MASPRKIELSDIKPFVSPTGAAVIPVDEKVLKDNLEAAFQKPRTIFVGSSTDLTGLFNPSLDRKGIEAELSRLSKADSIKHTSKGLTRRSSIPLTGAIAGEVANHIYAAVQYAAFIKKLDDYPKFKELMADPGIKDKLKNYWLKNDTDINTSSDKFEKMLGELSDVEVPAVIEHDKVVEIINQVKGIFNKYLQIENLLEGMQAAGADIPLVREVVYNKNIKLFNDAPAFQDILSSTETVDGERIKDIVAKDWGAFEAPSYEKLQNLWVELAQAITKGQAIAAIRKSFGANVSGFIDRSNLLGSAAPTLATLKATAIYQRFLAANKNNPKLLEVLKQPAVRDAIIKYWADNNASFDEINRKVRDFRNSLKELKDDANAGVISALNNVVKLDVAPILDLAAILGASTSPTLKLESTGGANTDLLKSIRAGQQYADFMDDASNRGILSTFPSLKAYLESQQIKNYLTDSKNIDLLSDKSLTKLIEELQKPGVTLLSRGIITYLQVAGVAGAITLDEAKLKKELANYQVLSDKRFDEFPTLRELFRTESVLKKLQDQGIQIYPIEFIKTLLEADISDDEKLRNSINITAFGIDNIIEKPFPKDLKEIRGELRLYIFLHDPHFSELCKKMPELEKIFNDKDVRDALGKYWQANDNWLVPGDALEKISRDLVAKSGADTASVIHESLKKIGSTIPGLEAAVNNAVKGKSFNPTKFNIQAGYAKLVDQLKDSNPVLSKILATNAKLFQDKLFVENKSVPSLLQIQALEKELVETLPAVVLDDKSAKLANLVTISDKLKKLFDISLSMDEDIELRQSLGGRKKLEASLKYSVFLQQFADTPELTKLFLQNEVREELLKYWAAHSSPTPARFDEFIRALSETSKSSVRDSTRNMIEGLITGVHVGQTTLGTAIKAVLPDGVSSDDACNAIAAEARWLVFKGKNPALAEILGADFAKEFIAKSTLSNPIKVNELLTGLAALPKEAKEETVLTIINTHLGIELKLVSGAPRDLLAIRAAARYDKFILDNESILNRSELKILKEILTNPAMRKVLVEHWKSSSPPSSSDLNSFVVKLGLAKGSSTKIREEFENFFGMAAGLQDALKSNGVTPGTASLKSRNLSRVAQLESARIAYLSRIDHPLLRDAMIASGMKIGDGKELESKTMVDALNKFMRENSPVDNAVITHQIKSVRGTFVSVSSRIVPSDAELDKLFKRQELTSSDYAIEQKRINAIYRTFSDDATVTELKDVDARSKSPIKLALREIFLKNKWALPADEKPIKKLLAADFGMLKYDDFIANYLHPVLTAGGISLTTNEIKKLLTQKDFEKLQQPYFLSNINFEQFVKTLASEKAMKIHRVDTLEVALNKALESKSVLKDRGYSVSADMRESKESLASQIKDNENIKDQLEKLLQERKAIAKQLEVMKKVAKEYSSKKFLVPTAGTLTFNALKSLWVGAALPSHGTKAIEIEQIEFNKILKFLKDNDLDEEIRDGAKSILDKAPKHLLLGGLTIDLEAAKTTTNEKEKKAYNKLGAIYFALSNEKHFEKISKSNDKEIERLETLQKSAEKVGSYLKEAQNNEGLAPDDRLIATYYSDMSHLPLNATDQQIQEAYYKLSDKYSSAPEAKMTVVTDDSKRGVRLGEVKQGSLRDHQTIFYDKTLDMCGKLKIEPNQIELSFRMEPRALVSVLGSETARFYKPTMRDQTDKDGKPKLDPADPEQKRTLKEIAVHGWQKAETHWREFKGIPTPKNIENHLLKNMDVQGDEQKLAKVKAVAAESYKKYMDSAWKSVVYSRSAIDKKVLLPNPFVFEGVIKNINTLAALHQLQTLPDAAGKRIYGACIKIETNDYALYVAMMCAATIKGYEVEDASGFRHNLEMKLTQDGDKIKKYIKALKHPANGYVDLFKDVIQQPIQKVEQEQKKFLQESESFTPRLGGKSS